MREVNYEALREAAQNYQSTLAWYQATPDSPNAERDCDAALAAFKRHIRHREADIIAGLLDGLEEAKSQLNEQREYYEGVISDGSKRIAELEKSEEQLINERDHAESALADMYFATTGDRPEWSNCFSFSDAVDAVVDRIADLEAKQPSPVVPEEKPMPNPLSMYTVDAVAAIAEVRGWNACRAAMLKGDKS